ncbi:EVE domain-containing protein [Varunaivibrio sulfuroxidans]|uniref:Putative RNA-binding protein with PUA-like domain n=1 Tax=Varunaivibrio sulfuroxidans TaxID=1773489 RepID=A0A4R3JG32_9PROT|nr:EVE domain-containing protein [Varunaivibrio sulfuroxidans]TCS64817.1 putative RNA-binding protein with PUA-like domain [Varunaivibrio sulfuroxidans]WES29882.1 EVE domain-containing protein [Varunaivibrio sulfuroxidans]
MAHWLVKSEPSCWSWDDHVRKGTEPWDGVRNHQAAKYLRAMEKGDRVFFYHSVTQKSIVGVLEVVRTAYPDPSDPSGRFVSVDLKARDALPRPVSLAEMKADPRLEHLALFRQSRLSVAPIDDDAWETILSLAAAPSTSSPPGKAS